MYKQENISSFTIICTNDGYMIEHQPQEDDMQYVHAPNGDNLFDTYQQAVIVLTQHLLKEII